MPYDLWQMEEPKGGPHSTQAFIFDGWSHEPLVIQHKHIIPTTRQHDVPTKTPVVASKDG
jgi:hypothetical protein